MSSYENRVHARVHPFRESGRHTYEQICRKVESYFGVGDAEQFFKQRRQSILDRCEHDAFGITRARTLREYWEAKQLAYKWREPMHDKDLDSKSAERGSVEIYAVRGPGSGGELGVLTTEHELERYLSGLAAALAKYLCGLPQPSQPDMERRLHWILKNGVPIAFKLAGYRVDTVVERHVLMSGSSMPGDNDVVSSSV